ncbi:MAG: hypothetical protein JWN17_390 [Frankiales bacterium]|nr:hypothetical protein [Frankiales bacterium]
MTWLRVPGQGSYARPERERRFLLSADPPALRDVRLLEDRYLDGLRLRLRRVTGDGEAVHKLTQKVRLGAGPAELSLTNLYLDAGEHARLVHLPGADLRKTRGRCPGSPFVVDVFTGRHAGLRLAEAEVDDLAARLHLPDWIGREVTDDERYTGGALARASDEELAALLRR